MKCPFCAHLDSRVVNSRPSDDGSSIRRRRECGVCTRRFTTYERPQLEPLMVIKRSGLREPFNPDKLLRGLLVAAEKRPLDQAVLRAFAYQFEDEVGTNAIQTHEIGRRVMTFLRSLDEVAYLRFASVYQSFDCAEQFIEVIQEIRNRKDDDGNE